MARKEEERRRRELFDDALAKFKKGKVEEVRGGGGGVEAGQAAGVGVVQGYAGG